VQKLVTTFTAAAALLAVWLPSAAPQGSAQDVASVALSIEKYVSVTLDHHALVMTTVDGTWWGVTKKTLASTLVDVEANTDARLEAPLTVELKDTVAYPATADICIIGENLSYGQDESSQWVDLPAGNHPNAVTVQVKIDKQWGPEDVAGTYMGTVTLEVRER